MPIEKLGQEKYEQYCRDVSPKDSPTSPCNATCCRDNLNHSSSTNLNDELTSDQESQPHSNDSGFSSPRTASGPSSGEMTVISTDYAAIHQEIRLRMNSDGAASPPQSGVFSNPGSDGAVSPPLSAVFSNPGSGEIGTVPMTEEE